MPATPVPGKLSGEDNSGDAMHRTVLPVIWVVAAGLGSVGDATAIELAAHRAFYELHLNRADHDSGVADARGAMSVDWGRSCDGWTVNQRLRLIVSPTSGESSTTDITFSSFEASDGLTYTFTTRTTRDGQLIDEYRGEAGRAAANGVGEARYSVPSGTVRDLPAGTVFPMEHIRLLLEAAERGETRLFRRFFDGPRPEESPFDANALILGGPHSGNEGPGAGMGAITESTWWPMRIAFFPRSGADSVPDFELAAHVQENGVVRQYVFDYGEFELLGDLKRIEVGETPRCAR